MTARKPLVYNSAAGVVEQLQAGDTLEAGVTGRDIITLTNANAGALAIGTPVFIAAAGQVDAARANAIGTTEVLGLVADASINPAASGAIQTDGVLTATTGQWDTITGDTGGLTPGSTYFLSPSAAGQLTKTAPSATGQYAVRIGRAISTTEFEISIQPPIRL